VRVTGLTLPRRRLWALSGPCQGGLARKPVLLVARFPLNALKKVSISGCHCARSAIMARRLAAWGETMKAMKRLSLTETDFTRALGDRGYHQKNRTLEEPGTRRRGMHGHPDEKAQGREADRGQKRLNRALLAIRAVVEHPFRVVKEQSGFIKGPLLRPQ
jgi:hypothetical protein